ncbi:hypothetical protein ILP92_17335 [Maribius pontilimi]|uniref:Lipoprotein n=1 Tax=Palleronia pontilimi TaxID=1964209 RepID=A0A934IK93_9RHOB|nr:hypothetical protein [Palleronia pontilimi]MBJ3764502.1 hypothetical protein [Palleronia pontilimi]
MNPVDTIMKPAPVLLALVPILGLAACAEQEPATTYPMSEQPCSPADPVQDLSADIDCAPSY